MNGRTVLIGSCVLGSLVGLGFLVNYVYGKEPEKPESKGGENQSKKPDGQEQDNYNRKRDTAKENSRRHPGKRHDTRRKINPEPKEKMVETEKTERPVADEFPLRFGSKGERVERLQVWLMRNYGWTGRISGLFDEKTEAQVQRFLKKSVLDEETYYKMKMGKPVYEQIVMR